MSNEEKIALLEEIMDLDEGTLSMESELNEIDEWDSLSKLGLIAMAKKEFGITVKTSDIKSFVTVADICEFLS